jgi:uncharacterized protein YjbJ (UPF0337 family)
MNKDQAKGTIKVAAGKMQNKVGQAIGSESQQAKGVVRQVEGHLQKTVCDTKQAVKDILHKA